MSGTISLIDGDIIVYRSGFAAEKRMFVLHKADGTTIPFEHRKDAAEASEEGDYIEHERYAEPVSNALHSTKLIMQELAKGSYEVFLTGGNNFRKGVATLLPYKANRDKVGKPIHYRAIRDYLIKHWGAKVVDGQEADDEIGIRATEIKKEGGIPIIVSIDKDLRMIPGTHYNWVTGTVEQVTEFDAWYNFFKQCLVGDRTDNIPGIAGIGEKKAVAILDGCSTKASLQEAVEAAWCRAYPSGFVKADGSSTTWDRALREVKELLWIRRARPHEEETRRHIGGIGY